MSAKQEFKRRIAAGLANDRASAAIHAATWHKVASREQGMATLRDPEALRELAREIKAHTITHLPDYLKQFVAAARANGMHVHFAPDAAAARGIITKLAVARSAKLAVKAKSMATEEIELNPALEAAGVRTVETDLGEFIVQLDRDRPSHIVTPIIHKDRRQIATAMQREIDAPYTEDPVRLSRVARDYLRDIFRRADFGITGANFAIAESGALCLCTNEGNGRMCITRPRTHVALVGIEKLIPRLADLSVYLKLLARAGTGQPLTVYTTLINGPRRPNEHDGPEEVHVVLLDNNRSKLLGTPEAEVLHCIRCGACLNACPVFRNIGGHAYNSTYPGPIGKLLTPLLQGFEQHGELPRASSLCGACAVACPVKIDIPELLVRLREKTYASQPLSKRASLRAWRAIMTSPSLYRFAQRSMPWLLRIDATGWVKGGSGPVADWLSQRDLPAPDPEPFRARWEKELRNES